MDRQTEAKSGLTGKSFSWTEMQSLLTQADLAESNFRENWQYSAIAYRALIWELANLFCQTKPGWSTELTHSEILRDEKTREVNTLDLCLDLMTGDEDNAEEGEVGPKQNPFGQFRDFLEEHANLIPAELRDKFKMHIGFNYGDLGGIVINKSEMRLISQDELEAFETEDEIGYPQGVDGFEKLFRFNALLKQSLKKQLQ